MFSFATCVPKTALQFLRNIYPDKDIKIEDIPLLVELLKNDILFCDFHFF